MIPGSSSDAVELGRDNDARLVRLRTALALGTGFQLVVVEAEPGPIRREVVRRIHSWSRNPPRDPLALVALDPRATLAAQLQVPSGAIVTGLELGAIELPARDWVAELNWGRDALPRVVAGPLVLVVSQALHQDLFERASDLYSWRRHTTRIALEVRELAWPLISPGDRYWIGECERISGLVAAVRDDHDRACRQRDLADALLQLGDVARASQAVDAAAALDGRTVPSGLFLRFELALARRDLAAARRGHLAAEAAYAAHRPDARADDLIEGVLAFARGQLHAAEASWDAATRELSRAVGLLAPASQSLTAARERLCQVALASGELARARSAIAALVEAVAPHLDRWGAGMLVRVASAIVDVYPDEIVALVDPAFAAAAASSATDAMAVIACLRASRWWQLGQIERARGELALARRWIEPGHPPALHAALSACEADLELAAGNRSDEVARQLRRACELFRAAMPRRAAGAGIRLGLLHRSAGRLDHAVAAYRSAADDARAASDDALVAEAERGELGAAVEGELGAAVEGEIQGNIAGESEARDAPERLHALARRFADAQHSLREGLVRTDRGRCLLRRGLRGQAIAELERARACFTASADATGERAVELVLEAMP